MLSFPRSRVRDLCAIFRHLSSGRSSPPPIVEWVAGRYGIAVRCSAGGVSVEYRQSGPLADGRFAVPLSDLNAAAGKDDSAVVFRRTADGRVELTWRHAGVPQTRAVPDPTAVPPFPEVPPKLTPNPAPLREALRRACEVAAPDPARYALHRLQLKGSTGEVVAGDGKRALIQGGFDFPWPDDILVAASTVFGCAALECGSVGVGRTDSHVWLSFGDWRVALEVDDSGRYPDVNSVVPPARADATRLVLDPADAARLCEVLPALPGNKDPHRPVTLDLNGRVSVRSRAEGQSEPTELSLGRSRAEGRPVRLATDRTFLEAALRLGFLCMQVISADKPVVCRDTSRTFVWVPLGGGALEPSPGAHRVGEEGKAATTRRSPTPPAASTPAVTKPVAAFEAMAEPVSMPKVVSEPMPMPAFSPGPTRDLRPARANRISRGTGGEVGVAVGIVPEGDRPCGSDFVAEAVALRDELRGLLGRVQSLIAGAKAERRRNAAVRTTLASLRQLQRLDS